MKKGVNRMNIDRDEVYIEKQESGLTSTSSPSSFTNSRMSIQGMGPM